MPQKFVITTQAVFNAASAVASEVLSQASVIVCHMFTRSGQTAQSPVVSVSPVSNMELDFLYFVPLLSFLLYKSNKNWKSAVGCAVYLVCINTCNFCKLIFTFCFFSSAWDARPLFFQRSEGVWGRGLWAQASSVFLKDVALFQENH